MRKKSKFKVGDLVKKVKGRSKTYQVVLTHGMKEYIKILSNDPTGVIISEEIRNNPDTDIRNRNVSWEDEGDLKLAS